MAGIDNIRIEGKRLVFEVRVVMESVAQGLEALAARPDALFMKEELNVLSKLLGQAAETLEAFSVLMAEEAE